MCVLRNKFICLVDAVSDCDPGIGIGNVGIRDWRFGIPRDFRGFRDYRKSQIKGPKLNFSTVFWLVTGTTQWLGR